MAQSDPIADALTMIRNASRARLEKTDLPDSRMTRSIVEILKQEGFVQNFRVLEGKPRGSVRVYLKYSAARQPVITQLQRVSKPGLRKYVGQAAVQSVLKGMGVSILTTSKGIMTDAQARAQGVGGELLCRVW